ncbi:MAG TPA: transcription antitermination factor NusB, partial [Sphaerochaeta sp.]|nr:transcription antitermination factor NusB [Sphaerochaeta sp.]
MKSRHLARELALQTLYALDFNNTLQLDAVEDTFSAMNAEEFAEFEEEVRLYGMYLVRGTIEDLEAIDELIGR